MSDIGFSFYDNQDFPIGLFSQKAYLPRLHHHIEYELFCLDKGTAELVVENESKILFAGDSIFLNPGEEHFIRTVKEDIPFHYEAIVFDDSILGSDKDPCRVFFNSIRINRYLELPKLLISKMKKVAEVRKEKQLGNEIFIKALLLEVIAYITQTNQYKSVSTIFTLEKYNIAAVDAAIAYIKEHYKENITATDVMSNTNYSRSHFSRLFRKSVGLNIVEYINKYRIEKACVDLIYTDKNITQIALDNGFNNIQYFSRVFMQFMNMTPKQYQKNSTDVVVPSSIPDGII